MPTDHNLPEKLPDVWLTQLKDALKQDTRKALLLTLLGSSLVAAIVTAGANFVLELVKQNNVSEIEKYKACLDVQKDSLKELRTVYSAMADKFRQFEADFSDCIATCEEALPNRGIQKPQDAYLALNKVANALIVIQSAADDTRLNEEVRASLNEIITPVILKIHATVDNDSEIAKVEKLGEFVEWAKRETPRIVKTKIGIETAIKSLRIEPCAST